MQTEIRQYIRDSKGNRTGVLLACKVGDTVRISWSACNKKDKFDIDKGMNIARSRMNTGSNINLPYRINFVFEAFVLRCQRYFKTDSIYYPSRTFPQRSNE